ncbi:MAG: hypothetical protein GY861_20130, partial [bacterium]|nr:hypothetical protein [bacterium]
MNEPNATLRNHKGELFTVHIENLSMPSPEILASGKIIPTSRKWPHASPQARKVSPEFISSEDEKSLETNSHEDKESSDTGDNQ